MSSNIVRVNHTVARADRARHNGHRGAVIWLTGLPASGKSTIAMGVDGWLFNAGIHSYVLDGDNVRSGLCSDLAFSADDRRENVRRVGEVAALFADAGIVAIAALISPYRSERDAARAATRGAFNEVFVRADRDVCESRDPKGHYARARDGEIKNFSGITDEYEAPLQPDLIVC
jgi:adenylyl-sulfate kinase